MQNALFLKNTQALFEVDEPLAYKLRSLAKPYDFKIIEENGGVNFVNQKGIKLYENANLELQNQTKLFQNEYSKYPILYFFGFGNGLFYKNLCKNPKHKHIIIFENELEILALAFHLQDFTQEIKNEKLILFHSQSLTTAQLSTLFTYKEIQKSVKIYNLFIHSEFYANFCAKEIQNVNEKCIDMIKYVVLNHGNNPVDSLIGIKHTLQNLPKLLSHGVFKEFVKERKEKLQNAIIVSTGPSLIKQLPLLKEYANKAAIFAADSSYPILAKYDIKPDYVFSLERVIETSKFFDNDFKEFDKDILFVLASLTHENTLQFLERNDRKYMLVHRPLPSALSLKLDDFGYLGLGMSVANMIFEFVGALKFKNVILIGQDLAYANDGSSHPKEHIFGEFDEQEKENIEYRLKTLAYGGKGEVYTQITWEMFRKSFEKDIFFTKEKLGLTTYNCTEGGARIEGSVEKPFKEVCEKFLTQDLQKPFEMPKNLDENEAKKLFKATQKLLEKNVKESEIYIKKCLKELEKLDYELAKEVKNLKTLKKIKENLIKFFKEFKTLKLFNELTHAIHFHNECELVKYEVSKKQDELLNEFLSSQRDWFFTALSYLQRQNESIIKALEIYQKDDLVEN